MSLLSGIFFCVACAVTELPAPCSIAGETEADVMATGQAEAVVTPGKEKPKKAKKTKKNKKPKKLKKLKTAGQKKAKKQKKKVKGRPKTSWR